MEGPFHDDTPVDDTLVGPGDAAAADASVKRSIARVSALLAVENRD